MSRAFGKGETAHIVNCMYRAGNTGVIEQWKQAVAGWAQTHRTDPDAAAVNAWLPLWQPRPFYTVEELAPMWPALAIATGYTDRWPSGQLGVKSPFRLEKELDFCGLPRLRYCRRYFICERIRFWQNANDNLVMQELQNALG